MDRRRFLQTFISTVPALTPLALAAAHAAPRDGELFLISDEPQAHLPALLREAEVFQPAGGRTFAFLTPHPDEQRLGQRLTGLGWTRASDAARAYMTLSFSPLTQPARPSFTFVRGGRIRDIRSRGLRSLWDRMDRNAPPATTLTIAGFRSDSQADRRGEFAAVFHGGRLRARLPLDRPGHHMIPAPDGRLVVRVSEGRARMQESPCRNRICLRTPPISMTGERLICAPHHLLLEIQGPGGLDAVIG
jgi:hypothetical protein